MVPLVHSLMELRMNWMIMRCWIRRMTTSWYLWVDWWDLVRNMALLFMLQLMWRSWQDEVEGDFLWACNTWSEGRRLINYRTSKRHWKSSFPVIHAVPWLLIQPQREVPLNLDFHQRQLGKYSRQTCCQWRSLSMILPSNLQHCQRENLTHQNTTTIGYANKEVFVMRFFVSL